MRIVICGLCVALTACSGSPTPYQEAKQQYGYLAVHHAGVGELCAAARNAKAELVRQAASSGVDMELEYLRWENRIVTHCQFGLYA